EYYEVMDFFNSTRDEDVWFDDPILRVYPDSAAASIDEIVNWIKMSTNDDEMVKKTKQFIQVLEPKYHAHKCTDFKKGELFGTQLLGLWNGGSCKLNNVYLDNDNQLVIRYNGWQEGGKITIREENEKGRIIATFPIRKTQGREVDFIPITPLSGYVDLHISFRNPALGENENSFSLEWFAFRKTLPGSDLSGYKSRS